MFICRVHAAPNEAQDVLVAESINAPRLMALNIFESTLSTRSLLIVQDGLCRRLAHKCRGSSPRRAPAKSLLYGLFTTTCGAGLLTSSWALTFWICAACSLSCAVNCATVASNASTLRFSMAWWASLVAGAWRLGTDWGTLWGWMPRREDIDTLFPLASTSIVPNFPWESTPTGPTKSTREMTAPAMLLI